MSLIRYIEAAGFRSFGPEGLGFVAGLAWSERARRARTRPTILAITHELFQKDLAEIDRHGRLNWIFLNKRKFGQSQKRLLPPETRRQRFYFPSLSDPKYSAHWRDIEAFGTGLVAAIRMRGPVDAVLSAHVDYWQDEGIRRACTRLGIPFLVLCQENYNIPKTYRDRQDEFATIGFRFAGSAIATFSDHMRDLFVASGVCAADRISVTGAPRLDGWQRTTGRPGKRVVLLSFLDSSKYYASGDFFFSVLASLQLAVQNAGEGWELVVKSKNSAGSAAILGRLGNHQHVNICHDTPLPELLSSASVVVGSSSLSMVEGLLSPAELFVPMSDSPSSSSDTSMFDPANELVRRCMNFVGSPELLEAAVAARLKQGPPAVDRRARLALVQRYVRYTEGEPSAQRVIDFIERYATSAASADVIPAAPVKTPPLKA